jgi:hypothetical protein
MWSKKPRPVATGFGHAIQVDVDADAGLPGVALHHGTCAAHPPAHAQCRPVPSRRTAVQLEAADAQILRELHVGLAVADHRR